MFAASDGRIYDVSVAGGQAVVQSGLTSDRWQYVNFTPFGAHTVIHLGNGIDPLIQYDGISNTWSNPAITGLPVGFTTASIIAVHAAKRRLWYTLVGSTIAAFMPTDAITGPIAGTVDMGDLWVRGGYLVGVASWTIDGGAGPQDYVVFLSSRGEISIFQGTDPTNASAWALVGTFQIAPPISRRCFVRIGSEVAILTLQGIIPISQVLPFDPSADRSVSLTARIQNAMAQVTAASQTLFGWQMLTYPAQQLFFLNVPLTERSDQNQYVMNMLTGAWTEFSGWNAGCFEIYNDKLYFGGNTGEINQAYTGGSDYNQSIIADVQCAFNWFENPGRTKRMTMVQPLLVLGGGSFSPTLAVDTDFLASNATAPVTTTIASGSLWDKAKWDVDAWSGGNTNFISWLTVDALGHAMAIRMRANINLTPNEIGVFDVGIFDTALFDAGFSINAPIVQINAFNSILELGGAI
jgi:hypothetical protein